VVKVKLKVNLKNLANSLLFLYSTLIFLDLTFELRFPIEAVLIFVMFVPGYGVLENFSPDIPLLEKLAASLGISVAVFLGLRALIEASKMWIFSEVTAASLIAMVSLAVVLIRRAR
jgi:hypothetical protein